MSKSKSLYHVEVRYSVNTDEKAERFYVYAFNECHAVNLAYRWFDERGALSQIIGHCVIRLPNFIR